MPGSVYVYWYDFGAVAAGLGQWDWLGTVQAGPLASGWLGPLGSIVQLQTPVPVVTSQTPASAMDAEDALL